MTTSFDMQTMIKASHYEGNRRVTVDEYGDKEVWMSIGVQGGSASLVLTFEEAKQVIEAINKVMSV